jgi:hypothetical protein
MNEPIRGVVKLMLWVNLPSKMGGSIYTRPVVVFRSFCDRDEAQSRVGEFLKANKQFKSAQLQANFTANMDVDISTFQREMDGIKVAK